MRRPAADLNEVERVVFEFFSESAKVTKLVEFLSLEEHKGRDKFDSRRFFMFKVTDHRPEYRQLLVGCVIPASASWQLIQATYHTKITLLAQFINNHQIQIHCTVEAGYK